MHPDLPTIVKRRHLATTLLRVLVFGLVIATCWRVAERAGEGLLNGSPVQYILYAALYSNAVFPIIIALLVVFERSLVNWLIPLPRPGCPRCGYSLKNLRSPICPECGLSLGSTGEGER